MLKILIWIGVIVAVLFGLRLLNVAKAKVRDDGPGARTPAPRAESMVRCVRCGIYLPSNDAKASPAGPICGEPSCAQRRRGDS